MKPSIGRVVHVLVDPRHNNGSDVAPAEITRVCSDTCVNVRITYDGPSVPPEGRQDWMTSMYLHESRHAAEAAHAEAWGDRKDEIPNARAFWPPRV
jgi:hypothetical protein